MKGEEEMPPHYMEQIQGEIEEQRMKSSDMARQNLSQFSYPQEDNLIRWQLDLREDLDRIYHLLQGHILKEDAEGNITYQEPKSEDLKPFNEFGVQMIMNVMAFYLNRNTILSNYAEETINWKVLDFSEELIDLIFNRYEEMGMDNEKKIKMYPMIVRELVDTVHSAYLRAYRGGERESLRTARTVHQNEPLGNFAAGNNSMPQQTQTKSRWFNPLSWAR